MKKVSFCRSQTRVHNVFTSDAISIATTVCHLAFRTTTTTSHRPGNRCHPECLFENRCLQCRWKRRINRATKDVGTLFNSVQFSSECAVATFCLDSEIQDLSTCSCEWWYRQSALTRTGWDESVRMVLALKCECI